MSNEHYASQITGILIIEANNKENNTAAHYFCLWGKENPMDSSQKANDHGSIALSYQVKICYVALWKNIVDFEQHEMR